MKLKQQKERPLNVPRLGLDPHYRVHGVHDAVEADSVNVVAVEKRLLALQLHPFQAQELDSSPKIEFLTGEGAIHYYYDAGSAARCYFRAKNHPICPQM